jgi:hypothetical protein
MSKGIVSRLKALTQRSKPQQFESAAAVERAIGFSRLRDQVWPLIDALDIPERGLWHWLSDVYFDSGSLYVLIYTSTGRLLRASLTVSGDSVSMGTPVTVTEMHVPTAENRVVTRVFETEDGRFRWLSISNVAIMNRVGELDSTALFDSFIAHANETGEYPYRTFWHQGEVMRTGQADFLARDGFCYITSGLYEEDNELALIEIAALQNSPTGWGESIGFEPTALPSLLRVADDVNVPVYTQGINREISTCPEVMAASWFTTPMTMEVNRMNEGVKKGLQQLMADAGVTDEDATALLGHFEGAVDRVNTHAQQPGVIARSTAAVPATAVAEEDAEKPNDEGEIVVDETVIEAIVAQLERSGRLVPPATAKVELPDVDAIVARVSEGLDAQLGQLAQQINDNFAALSGRIEAVEDALDVEAERLADMPETAQRTIVYRPSNQGTEGDEAPASQPAGLEKLPAY